MKNRQIDWKTTGVIAGYHLVLMVCLPIFLIYSSASFALIMTTLVLIALTGMGITGGYHRLFSHSTYETNPWIKLILLACGTVAIQGSALRWSFDHRRHHAFVDTDKDPYSINKGFWHAHWLWLFRKQDPIDPKYVKDLIADKMIVFQDRYYGSLALISNLILYGILVLITRDYWGSFVIGLLLRVCVVHHCTWFINSLAHYWGAKTFSQEHTARNNFIISLLTFGEGYHNYHHTYANDYRNGVRWYQYDPTKWLIWTLSKVGLTYNLKRVCVHRVNERIVQEKKTELLDHLKEGLVTQKENLKTIIVNHSTVLIEKLKEYRKLTEQLQNYRNAKVLVEENIKHHLSFQIKALKKSIRTEWKNWNNLCRMVYSLQGPSTV